MGRSHPVRHRRLTHVAGRFALFVVLLAFTGLPALTTPQPAAAQSLGGGWYHTLATVFGTANDGNIGGMTASGYYLKGMDRLVALPACTESSCPWLSSTNPTAAATERWGPQTLCAEADGFCWVELVSDETGVCTVAPVRDVGPLFTNDNWWAPRSQRMYDLPQGEPAAEAALRGADLGYGPGKSNVGYDVQHKYRYAAGIDMAEGTWRDLGLGGGNGLHQVRVRLLWQTGITHDQACDSGGSTRSSATDTANATVTEALNLRAGPSTGDRILAVMPGGARITVTGAGSNGFYPVVYNGTEGWAHGDWIRADGAGSGTASDAGLATVTEALNLRTGPSTSNQVITVMPAGALVTLTGKGQNGFVSVNYKGTNGWAYAAYLSGGSPPSTDGKRVRTTDALNLRDGPGLSSAVLLVMPSGVSVTLTGGSKDGFLELTYNGTRGWASANYLTGFPTATVDSALNLRTDPNLQARILTVMPGGAKVQLLGANQNGFAKVSYQGRTGWAYSAYLR